MTTVAAPAAQGNLVDSVPDPDYHTVWQVKASTLCNLRCTYCYEWDGLADKRRMSLDQWRMVFEALEAYRAHSIQCYGGQPLSFVAWHGGEPTLLPRTYSEKVLALQNEMLGPTAHDGGFFLNAAVTNLYSRNATLKLMIERRFMFSVSLDGAPGARVDRAGRDVEGRVLENLDWVVGQGAACGVSMVVGRHNLERLIEIHDRLEEIGLAWLRLGAMIKPPEAAPGADLCPGRKATLAAMIALMEHRAGRSSPLTVLPLDRVERTAQHHREGKRATERPVAESRFIVRPDGTLATLAGTTTPERVLGNIFQQGIDDLIEQGGVQALTESRALLQSRHCAACRFDQACDQRAVEDLPPGMPAGPCWLESKLAEAALERQ